MILLNIAVMHEYISFQLGLLTKHLLEYFYLFFAE